MNPSPPLNDDEDLCEASTVFQNEYNSWTERERQLWQLKCAGLAVSIHFPFHAVRE